MHLTSTRAIFFIFQMQGIGNSQNYHEKSVKIFALAVQARTSSSFKPTLLVNDILIQGNNTVFLTANIWKSFKCRYLPLQNFGKAKHCVGYSYLT
jgi:hypothetical protein